MTKRLRRAWEKGRERRPQVDLPFEVFARHVGPLLPESSHEEEGGLNVEELYLACACVEQVPGAHEALERDYLAILPARLSHLRLSATVMDEVCQKVREHLLVGSPKAGPKLAGYKGKGSLLTWMQVMATRMARRLTPPAQTAPEETGPEALPMPEPDAEFALIRRHYRRDFQHALSDAFAALSAEQRFLLQLHFMEGVPTTRMAPLFGKDQATISRWLKAARARVYEETKRLLLERLRLSSREFESLTNAIRSNFDVSLSQLLGDGEEREDKEAN